MSDAFICFLSFYILVLPAAFIVRPLVKRIFSRHLILYAGSPRNFPTLVPSLAIGLALFLLFFSLFGRIIDSYFVTVPLAYLSLYAMRRLCERFDGYSNDERVAWSTTSDGTTFVALLALHLALLFLRSYFSNIHYDPNQFGAEKLFNYSFQQAFLFGAGYPPESLWLAGESIVYYLLPKSVAGLVSHFLREGLGMFTGGILFHVGDTFFTALSAVCLGTYSFIFLRMFSSRDKSIFLGFCAAVIGLYPLLSAPARAVSQAFSSNIELWSLSRIIDNTVNEYPFWNFLWADNHAHSSVMFMQLTLWFWLIFLMFAEKLQGLSISLFIGGVASAVLLSHSGSVLINLVSMGTFLLVQMHFAIRHKNLRGFVQRLVPSAIALILFSMPDLLTRGQPSVTWYLVPPRLASKLAEYFNIHFLLSCALPLVLIFGTLNIVSSNGLSKAFQKLFFAHVILFAISFAAGYPVVGFALLLSGGGLLLLGKEQASDRRMLYLKGGALYAASLFLVWPELIVANWNMGDDYMRYNTLFRFLFESFYIVPLLWVFGLASLSDHPFRSPVLRQVAAALLTVSALIFLYTQAKTFGHRVTRIRQTPSFDGTAFLKTDRPLDDAIIGFLQRLEGRVVLAEECGVDPKPSSYTVAGRIATYSGRVGICGWAHHISLFHSRLHNPHFKGEPAYANVLEREKWMNSYFDALSTPTFDPNKLEVAKHGFKKLGVTHLIYGEYEKKQRPNVNLEYASRIGQVIYRNEGTAVIALNLRSQSE